MAKGEFAVIYITGSIFIMFVVPAILCNLHRLSYDWGMDFVFYMFSVGAVLFSIFFITLMFYTIEQ